jgi:ABC-type transport system involved in cytochrome c biogenesis permease subunit
VATEPAQPKLKTPDFSPEAILALVLGAIANLIVLFKLDITDAQQAAVSGIVTSVVLAAYLIHSAVIRNGRARALTPTEKAPEVPKQLRRR